MTHFRVLYLVGAVGVLLLLRKPLRYPDRPGSRWFALTIVAVAVWLTGVGLYYLEHSRAGSFALYCLVLFSISVCFVGWLLVSIEFSTGRAAPRAVVAALAVLVIAQLLVLVTNSLQWHELVYRHSSFVDTGGGINVRRGPLFWVHVAAISVLVYLSKYSPAGRGRLERSTPPAGGGLMLLTPVFELGPLIIWFAEVLPFDPTPMGVTLGMALLGSTVPIEVRRDRPDREAKPSRKSWSTSWQFSTPTTGQPTGIRRLPTCSTPARPRRSSIPACSTRLPNRPSLRTVVRSSVQGPRIL